MKRRQKTVVVLGAGVAGLTAAHELVNRGFDVTVYEQRRIAGGKSRSYSCKLLDVNGDEVPGFTVPGEHGFRFFPGFYRHLDDTMQQIPAPPAYRTNGRRTVLDCLTPVTDELLAVAGRPPVTVPAAAPRTVEDLRDALRLPGTLGDCGLTDDDLATFSNKLWQIATSCPERRHEEYEKIGWRDFVESKDRSDEYYWYLASGLTRALVAARARYASTKTMGDIALRLFSVALNVGQTTDRVLCGPTNDVWINPWVSYITSRAGSRGGRPKGRATIEKGFSVTDIGVEARRVTHVVVSKHHRKEVKRETADYYVSALPVEELSRLVEASPGLSRHREFRNVVEMANATGSAECLRKMSGLQIYCRKELYVGKGRALNKGHQLLLDSPWGLTSIAQRQFWDRLPERVGDILSVDISSWDMKGLEEFRGAARTAFECTQLEVFREVLAQIRAGLGKGFLTDSNIIGWHLDDSPERLLVNRVDSWRLRPTANTPVENLVLAGDFVQTGTDLACMEGANESARIAVNSILTHERVPAAEQCPVWAAQDPAPLRVLQEVDRYRYERGLAWSGSSAVGKWIVRGAHAAAAAADPLGRQADERRTSGVGAHRVPRATWDDSPPKTPVAALTSAEIQADLTRFDRYAQPGRSDSMFQRWRLYRRKNDPKYLVPLHIYDADTLVIYGTVENFEYLEELTNQTGYYPVSSEIDGRPVGFAELWLVRYNDTSMGPCTEVAINFVTNTDKNKPRYRYGSVYSALVPMMDSSNRLFTPEVIVEEKANEPGCIEYGNDLFGMNKLRGRVRIEPGPTYTFKCSQKEKTVGGRAVDCDEEDAVTGEVDVRSSRLDATVSGIGLAGEIGPLAAARNWQQCNTGVEISGGMATRDFRRMREGGSAGLPAVDIKAAYKFAPTICYLDPKKPLTFGTSQFGRMLRKMAFKEAIAAHEPHLKSVLYRSDWPTPDDDNAP